MADQRLSFTFHKCLGKGGFGEVYLATLTRPGGLAKRVAVKVLKEDLRHAEAAVQRLRDEGRMLAILEHPCILRVLEMTLIQGRVALVTEYIDGIDLARCCTPDRLLPQSVVVGALGEVASALHCAWTTQSPETGKALKLIHRDVKPENIRIGKHGEVKLLDFGIARTTEMFRHAKTAQGDLPFTPGYAAPEAFTKGFQGSASDVYALGVSMYRLLVGERLYEEMDLSEQVSICCLPERYAPFLRDRLARVDAPEALMELLRDMLAYEAIHRPSAIEIEDRTHALMEALPGPSHVRWARAQDFPEPTGLPDGSLTGMTLEEDDLERRRVKPPRGVQLKPRSTDASRGLLDQPDTAQQRPQSRPDPMPGAVADLTPPMLVDMVVPPPPPTSQSGQMPPPVPSGIHSVRPTTAPFPKPRPGADPVQPGTQIPDHDATPLKGPGSFLESNDTLSPHPADLTGGVGYDPKGDPKRTLDAWMHEADLAHSGVDVRRESGSEPLAAETVDIAETARPAAPTMDVDETAQPAPETVDIVESARPAAETFDTSAEPAPPTFDSRDEPSVSIRRKVPKHESFPPPEPTSSTSTGSILFVALGMGVLIGGGVLGLAGLFAALWVLMM